MKQICVTIRVSPAAAVRAGKTQVGEVVLTLNDKDLESLSAIQREALARHLDGDEGWCDPLSHTGKVGGPYYYEVAEASLDSLKRLLEARIEREVAEAESKQREIAEAESKVLSWLTTAPIEAFFGSNSDPLCDWWQKTVSRDYAYVRTDQDYFRFKPDHRFYGKTWAEIAGREEEALAFLKVKNADQAAKRDAAARDRERRKREAQAEEEAKLEAGRAACRDFIHRHRATEGGTEDESVLLWFDQLKDHQAAKPVIKAILMVAVAKYMNEKNLSSEDRFSFYDASCGFRYGPPLDAIDDLSEYRRMRVIRQTIDDALEEAMISEVSFKVESVAAWRTADDGDSEDEIDEDGDVLMPGFFVVRVVVGDITMNLYVS